MKSSTRNRRRFPRFMRVRPAAALASEILLGDPADQTQRA
jgi:hypothetical protein